MSVLDRYRPIIDDFAAFKRAIEQPLPYVVRTNTIKTTPERVMAVFDDRNVSYTQLSWNENLLQLETDSPGNTLPWFLGWVHGQEAVSALPARILDPTPGDRVLDAAAAPGSKATQLAALMNDTGRLVANDRNLGRLAALRSNAERLGVTNMAVTNRDAREFEPAGFAFDQFDRVLVDVPCSGEGTIRKDPTALDDWSQDHVDGIAAVQKGILRQAVQLTAPGGRIVYSTCTFAPEENEAVLDHVLAREPVELVAQSLPLTHTGGVTEWQDTTYDPAVQRAARIYPHHNDTGGFFIATLEVRA